jgi:hypothetical protein
VIELLVLSVGFAGATWMAGWWAVPLVAALWVLWRGRSPWRVALAAALAWAGLLSLTIPTASLGRLAPRLGGIFGVPGWAALILTPIYALALAWAAARVVMGVRRER